MRSDGRPLTIDDVVEVLSCSKSSIYQKVRSGQLRAFQPGRRLYFQRADVDRYLLGGRRKITNKEHAETAEASR